MTDDVYEFMFKASLAEILGGKVKVTFGGVEQLFPIPDAGY